MDATLEEETNENKSKKGLWNLYNYFFALPVVYSVSSLSSLSALGSISFLLSHDDTISCLSSSSGVHSFRSRNTVLGSPSHCLCPCRSFFLLGSFVILLILLCLHPSLPSLGPVVCIALITSSTHDGAFSTWVLVRFLIHRSFNSFVQVVVYRCFFPSGVPYICVCF